MNYNREKRAWVAYLQWLLDNEYHKTITDIDGNGIQVEIEITEKYIADLDILIERAVAIDA